jgi:hypothetical protein
VSLDQQAFGDALEDIWRVARATGARAAATLPAGRAVRLSAAQFQAHSGA